MNNTKTEHYEDFFEKYFLDYKVTTGEEFLAIRKKFVWLNALSSFAILAFSIAILFVSMNVIHQTVFNHLLLAIYFTLITRWFFKSYEPSLKKLIHKKMLSYFTDSQTLLSGLDAENFVCIDLDKPEGSEILKYYSSISEEQHKAWCNAVKVVLKEKGEGSLFYKKLKEVESLRQGNIRNIDYFALAQSFCFERNRLI